MKSTQKPLFSFVMDRLNVDREKKEKFIDDK